MTYIASDTPWHSTDGDAVPIHAATLGSEPSPIHIEDDIPPTDRRHYRRIRPPSDHHALAAFTGIAVVLVLSTGFYFGLNNLRSSLLNTAVKVTITKSGTFDPATITLARGQSLTLINQHADPQVIKPKGNDLFPPQVLFADPTQTYSFTVPDNAPFGTYVYFSETLPDAQTLSIVIAAADAATTSSESSSVADLGIPIPNDLPLQTQAVSSSTSPQSIITQPPSSNDIPPAAPTTHTTSGQAQLDVTIGAPSQASSAASTHAAADTSPAALPTNPYTVGNALGSHTLKTIGAVASAGMHSGAPLITSQRPATTTSTGPGADIALSGLAALLFFVLMYKRSTRKILR